MSRSNELVADPKARVRAVVQQGSSMDFNEGVPLRRYLRSASELYRMASVYKEEGSLQQALKLYTRYITLLVENAPKHPQYNSISKEEKSKCRRHLEEAFKMAELLKTKLEAEFELDAVKYQKEQEERKAIEAFLDQTNRIADDADRISGPEKELATEGPVISNGDAQPIIVNTHDIAFPAFDSSKPSAPPLPATTIDERISTPAFDRATKPKDIACMGNTYLPSNQYGLRDVCVPRNLVEKFMQLAEENTARNIETCGVLCGKLANNRFIVTHLVIPRQHGTSDSCTTDHEEDVFDFQDKYDLVTLGWIHTHPSQSAFLSSVDMHTHCSYQLMLPEAIAVVCSPRYQETGIFMLSPDYGLKEISSCRRTGFHPHEQNPPLFVTCPHASFSEAYNAALVDLRKPKGS